MKITTYCGPDCDSCDYREKMNCGGCVLTKGHPFHGECRLAQCAIAKGMRFCGECPELPCALLKEFSSDPEQGDTPPGARIERCIALRREQMGENPGR